MDWKTMAWSRMGSVALALALACFTAGPPAYAARDPGAALGNDAAHHRLNDRFLSATYRRCAGRSVVTSTTRECDLAENNRLDRLVATTLRKRLSGLPKAQAAALRRDQRQWSKRRKHYCDNLPESGGTIDLLIYDECYIFTSIERVRALQR